MKTFQDFSP